MSAQLMRSYLDLLNEQQQQLDEGIMDSIKSVVPKIMKALGGDTVAQIAQQVKQATGGDYTLNQDNAVKVAKALGFEEILKTKMQKDPQGSVSEAWGLAGNWQGKLIQLLHASSIGWMIFHLTSGGAGGIFPGRLLAVFGFLALMLADTFWSTDRGMVGAMGRDGRKGTETT